MASVMGLQLLPLWSLSIVPIHSLPLPEGAELQLEIDVLAKIW